MGELNLLALFFPVLTMCSHGLEDDDDEEMDDMPRRGVNGAP